MSDEEKKQALILYAAYRKDAEGKFHYLGNGEGGIRLFRSQSEVDIFLDENIPPEKRAEIFTHPLAGHIVVPEPEPEQPLVISTLAFDNLPPTVQDQLNAFDF